jgi:peptidase E
MIKAVMAENERKREENLAAKKELLAKALELSNIHTARIKDWMEHSTAANQLMEEWKKIGMVPMKYKESLWEEFRSARNKFFNNKNEFFKKLHAERNNNLKVKTDLCEKAESISANPIDWNKQTDELKKLQEAWKTVGPVHEKISDAIWKRFRTACDGFFEKKAQHYAGQVEEQKQNLEIKNGLLAELETLLAREDGANIINELKALQEQWNKAGFVPMNAKEAINKKYNELTDKVFNKFKQAHTAMRDMKDRGHFEALLNSPNGGERLKREERFIQEKIRGMKSDIDTWENNLGFFAKSKGENPMVEQIKDKIAGAQKQIKQLEDKMKLIRNIGKEAQKQ